MQPRSLEDRVTLLENKLQGLPERVGGVEVRLGAVEVRLGSLESQFVQFRSEVRAEFSATRAELRKEIHDSIDGLHGLHKKLDQKFDARIDAVHAEMHALHAIAMLEMSKAFERSMSLTRTLHEEAISQIKLIKNG